MEDTNIHYATGILTLSDLIPFIELNSIVFLDLDDTLILLDIVTNKRMKIEENINDILEEMRRKGAIIVGCSARSYSTMDRVTRGLNEAEVILDHSNLNFLQPFTRNEKETIGYSNGVLCCPHFGDSEVETLDKASGIIYFLDELKKRYSYEVKKVLFADDAESNVKLVHEKLKENNIHSACFQFQEGLNLTMKLNEKYGGYQDIEFEVAKTKDREIIDGSPTTQDNIVDGILNFVSDSAFTIRSLLDK
jgi:hydroxymethylpyrimidine pyrophosphatase-like HAD family hydrolase